MNPPRSRIGRIFDAGRTALYVAGALAAVGTIAYVGLTATGGLSGINQRIQNTEQSAAEVIGSLPIPTVFKFKEHFRDPDSPEHRIKIRVINVSPGNEGSEELDLYVDNFGLSAKTTGDLIAEIEGRFPKRTAVYLTRGFLSKEPFERMGRNVRDGGRVGGRRQIYFNSPDLLEAHTYEQLQLSPYRPDTKVRTVK